MVKHMKHAMAEWNTFHIVVQWLKTSRIIGVLIQFQEPYGAFPTKVMEFCIDGVPHVLKA